MCIDFLIYYPRKPTFKNCISVPEPSSSKNFYSNLNISLYENNSSLLVNEFANFYNNLTSIVVCGNVSFQLNKLNFYLDLSYFIFLKDILATGPIKPSNIYVEPNQCYAPKPVKSTFTVAIEQFFQNIFNFITNIINIFM